MIELNLLPDVKKEFINAQRTRNTVISVSILVTIAAGVITFLLAATVYGGQTAVMAVQTDSIKKKEDELKKKPEINKYLTVQNQLQNIDSLHSTKPLFSQVFAFMQILNPATPNNIALTNLDVYSAEKRIEISGSVRNFEALTVFETTLKNAKLSYTTRGSSDKQSTQLFESVNLLDASLKTSEGPALVNFRIQLFYPEIIFNSATENAKVEIPTLVTSDADRNAPKELFGTEPGGNQ